MKKVYKAAIIGMGNIGYGLQKYEAGFATTHFEAYLDHKQIDLVAVSDIKNSIGEEIKRKYKSQIRFYGDWRALIAKENPDIISICTPDETHYQILKGVANSKAAKAIWCEKPIAITLKQGKDMVEICRSKDIKLSVNYTRRYDDFYKLVENNLQSLLGEIKVVTSYYSGGITTVGSHMLDLLNFFFGDCLMVRGKEISGEIMGVLEFENCRTVNLVPITAKSYSIFEINILGENGRLNIYGKPFNEYDYQYSIPQKSDKINAQFISVNEKTPFPRNLKRNYMNNALADILESISSNREPFSSGETALNTLEILSALAYSAKNREKIISFPFTKINTKIPRARGDLKIWQKKN